MKVIVDGAVVVCESLTFINGISRVFQEQHQANELTVVCKGSALIEPTIYLGGVSWRLVSISLLGDRRQPTDRVEHPRSCLVQDIVEFAIVYRVIDRLLGFQLS